MTTITRNDILMGLAVVTVFVMGGLIMAYGVIIGAWLSAIATITAIGAGGAVAIGLAYGAGLVAFRGAYGAIRLGYHAAMSKEALEQAKAESAMKWAMVDKQRADTALVTTQAMYQFHSVSGAAILVSNGRAEILHLPSQQSAPAMPLLAQGEAEFTWDDSKLFDVFRQAKSVHGLIIGARHSGKSTLLNGLMNEVLAESDITLIDPLFNKVESGWILPTGAKVSRDFVAGLTEFYTSHKKRADNSTTKRETGRKVLVIDETPSLLKQLKANDKETYNKVMAMLRAIYSQGSHTSHNVILLSQTVLSEDLDLSSNDKANFIQVCLGSLGADYLQLRRGKTGKKALYERLSVVANEFDHYAVFEDCKGVIDVQPLADLSQFGAKRLYGLADSESQADKSGAGDCPSDETMPDSTMTMVVDKPSIFGLPIMSEGEAAIIGAASELLAQGQFSFNKLHCKLTGVKVSGGKQNDAYKTILAKFGLIEAVTSQRT